LKHIKRKSNKIGAIAETKFMAKATEMGLVCCIPIYPQEYDIIIDNGLSVKKIQIKSTTTKDKERGCGFLLTKLSKYDVNSFDYIVVLVNNTNWYIVPNNGLTSKLRFNPCSKRNITSKYLEKWHVLLK